MKMQSNEYKSVKFINNATDNRNPELDVDIVKTVQFNNKIFFCNMIDLIL